MVHPAATDSRAQIIVNADDFGYTPGVSAGIILAYQDGVLSSTTAMMNTASVVNAVELAQREVPELPIGVHLVLTYGRPLSPPSQVPTLVDAGGQFHRLAGLRADPTRLAPAEVEGEWRRQIERLAGLGVEIDHLDSHHHVSYLSPALAEVMARLAEEFGLPVRRPPDQPTPDPHSPDPHSPDPHSPDPHSPDPLTPNPHAAVMAVFARHPTVWMPDRFVGDLIQRSSKELFMSLVQALPDRLVAEFMVHPAVVDSELCAVSGYAHPRGPELDTLLAPGLRDALVAQRVEVVTFREAARHVGGTPRTDEALDVR